MILCTLYKRPSYLYCSIPGTVGEHNTRHKKVSTQTCQTVGPHSKKHFDFNIKSHQGTKRIPQGVGISRKSRVGFKDLRTHDNF